MTKDAIPEEERTRCEIWTRVMGYFRPLANFNVGKKSEHKERKFYNVREEHTKPTE